jgi:hypothetical protein
LAKLTRQKERVEPKNTVDAAPRLNFFYLRRASLAYHRFQTADHFPLFLDRYLAWLPHMKRKAPMPRGGVRYGDVKKDLSHEQLAGIGAVAISFNDLEFELDVLLAMALAAPDPLLMDVAKRVKGLEDRVDLGSGLIG